MPYGNAERTWTLKEYIGRYYQLQAELVAVKAANERLRKNIIALNNNLLALVGAVYSRITELEEALQAIWPFLEEDFPKGTGDNHGTCAADEYLQAVRKVERALKGSK